ncbi:MAG: SGNH/GDSL hydrolase family protein [Defluviitaleaceae bacterium]|nr:SGNH/GDSL hydrolase family protein [Defluviitaleaceae bacterium]
MKIISAVAVFIIVFLGFQRLLMPKYASEVLEGGLIREYYSSAMNHDVIFIGDCEVYANFSTITLWEEFGITSFIRGSAQQLIWQSYYLLEETLRLETPQVVVFNVLSMQYNEPQSEPYNRLTLDGMRWSGSWIRSIRASQMPEEGWLSYFFPLFRYKARWREINSEDFQFFFNNPRVSINGFMVRSDIQPVGFLPEPLRLGNYRFGDNAYYYLERIAQICRDAGVELILIKAPTLFPHWHDQWDEQIVAFAEENNLLYINFLEYTEDMGIDFSTDTFNGGLHLNVFGAEKTARFLGEIIQSNFDIPDRRNEPEIANYWNELSELYHRIIARQQQEIADFGRIQNFLAE